jgi:hypothetical protein
MLQKKLLYFPFPEGLPRKGKQNKTKNKKKKKKDNTGTIIHF